MGSAYQRVNFSKSSAFQKVCQFFKLIDVVILSMVLATFCNIV